MRAFRAALRHRGASLPLRGALPAGLAWLAVACGAAPETAVVGPSESGLVFARPVGGQLDLARARLRDGAVAALLGDPEREERWPYWSPVAGRLVFQREAPASGSPADLWWWSPEDGEQPVTETPGRDERWPVWSPREARLVYAFRGGTPPSGLAWVQPGGKAPRLLARSDARAVYLRPAFAPDGRQLVVQRRGSGGEGSQLWRVEPGSPPEPLTRDPRARALKARFTRDGERVLFSRQPAAGGPHDVASVDRAGGDLRLHASQPASDDHSAAPSPTRDEIALVSNRAGSYDVWLADLPAGPPRPLTRTPELDEFAPRWSPDGAHLAVTVVPQGAALRMDDESSARARIRVLDREGRVLLETPGLMPDWMPAW